MYNIYSPQIQKLFDLITLLPDKAEDWSEEQLTQHINELRKTAEQSKQELNQLINKSKTA